MTLDDEKSNGYTSFATKNKTAPISEMIKEGIFFLSASQAGAIVRELRYDRQNRDNTPGGLRQISVLSDIMRRHRWRPKDGIDFARMPDGRLILINGHHRLRAQEISGLRVEWIFVIHQCESDGDVSALYTTFDTNTRYRSTNTILAALDLATEFGIRRETMKNLYNAVPLIACDFDLSKTARDPIMDKVIDRRVALAEMFKREIVSWEKATRTARGIKKKISMQGPLAVAMVTFRYQPMLAKQFWEGVVQNDGLARLDPRHTYLRYLHGEFSVKDHPAAPVRYAASAWNAWFDGERPKFFMVGNQIEKDTPIRIAGTKYDR